MKKMLAVLLCVLLLSGCKPNIAPTEPAADPTTTGAATEDSTQKTTGNATEEATQQPTGHNVDTPNLKGSPFTFDGEETLPTITDDAVKDCVVGHLYYYDYVAQKIYPILSEQVILKNANDTHVFYVKAAEPNRIYMTPKADFTQHAVLYEATYGEVTYLGASPSLQYANKALVFVEGSKRLLWFDLTTGETDVLTEQYYIEIGGVNDSYGPVDSWRDYNDIYFVGKLSEDDPIDEYRYYRDTGIVEEWPYL